MDFVKFPVVSFQTNISKEFLDNMQNGIVEGITKAEEALEKAESGGGSGTVTSVNGVEPDENGNVDVTVPTITAEAGTDRVFLTITNPDGTMQSVTILDGEDGANGVSPVVELEETDDGVTIFAGNADGTGQTAFVSNGKDGADGKSAYQYAVDGGYTGTEEEFAELMANGNGGSEEKVATAVDLSGYASGTVIETYSDGSTLTYTFEFDSDGNPTKITDSNGNETVLTW